MSTQKYSRSLLSEQIHQYILHESKHKNIPYYTFSFLLGDRSRIFIGIWTKKRYALAFYKSEQRGVNDITIKESYLNYGHQVWGFIDTIDTYVEKVELKKRENMFHQNNFNRNSQKYT